MPIRDEAINVFMGLPGDGAAPRADLQLRRRLATSSAPATTTSRSPRRSRRDARRPRRAGHRAREAAVHGERGRPAALLRARPGRLPDRAHRAWPERRRPRRVDRCDGRRCAGRADLGSNSFRLVVFTSGVGQRELGGWWKRTDEIYEPVRIGAGARRDRRARRGGRWRARSRRSRSSRTSATRPGSARRDRRGRDERDPRGRQLRGLPRRGRASATGLRDPRPLARGGGALRLPGGGQLDDAARRRACSTSAAARCSSCRSPTGSRRDRARGGSARCA